MLKPNLGLYLGIPALLSDALSEEEWSKEITRMLNHSRLTQLFLEGHISPSDYEDWLADSGLNPYEVEELWENGISLL